jgi:hypothetical protein
MGVRYYCKNIVHVLVKVKPMIDIMMHGECNVKSYISSFIAAHKWLHLLTSVSCGNFSVTLKESVIVELWRKYVHLSHQKG